MNEWNKKVYRISNNITLIKRAINDRLYSFNITKERYILINFANYKLQIKLNEK